MAYSAPLWSPSYLKFFFFFSHLKFLQRFSVHTFPKHFLISHSSKHSSQFAFSVTAIVKINTSIAYFSAFNLKVSFFKFYFCSLSWLIFKFPVVFFFFFLRHSDSIISQSLFLAPLPLSDLRTRFFTLFLLSLEIFFSATWLSLSHIY